MCYVYAEEIAKLFPCLFAQPSALLVPNDSSSVQVNKNLKIGVVLSGGQAPGGHNVISGLFGKWRNNNVVFLFKLLLISIYDFGEDYLQDHAKGSTLYGFKGGPAGIMKCKYVELTAEFIYPYRNQVRFLERISIEILNANVCVWSRGELVAILMQFLFLMHLLFLLSGWFWYDMQWEGQDWNSRTGETLSLQNLPCVIPYV